MIWLQVLSDVALIVAVFCLLAARRDQQIQIDLLTARIRKLEERPHERF